MVLQLDNIHQYFFGHGECLHDISCSFSSGVNALYGEVGSGKTTLLKTIAGINPYQGSITLDQQPLRYGADGNVRMVFDDLALFERRSAYYNITYPLRLRKVPSAQWDERLQPILQAWQLQPTCLQTAAFRLAPHIRVRLALARACLFPTDVLLLDNPLAGLGPDDRREAFQLLSSHIATMGQIVLYATDDLDEILSLAAPSVVLSGGYLVAQGMAQQWLADPPCAYVASKNTHYSLYQATLSQGKALLAFGAIDCTYPSDYEGATAPVGFLPSAVQFSPTPTQDALPAQVHYTTRYRGQPYSHLSTAAGTLTVMGDIPVGTQGYVRVNHIDHVFDLHNELRI